MLVPKQSYHQISIQTMTEWRKLGRTRAASAARLAASASLRAFLSTSSESSRVDASALAHWAVVSQASLETSGPDWIGFSEDMI